MSNPASDEQIASISFTDDGVFSCWETRNECLRALIARIRQEKERCAEAWEAVADVEAEVTRLRVALERIASVQRIALNALAERRGAQWLRRQHPS